METTKSMVACEIQGKKKSILANLKQFRTMEMIWVSKGGLCIVQELNPVLLWGKQEFYYWTTNAVQLAYCGFGETASPSPSSPSMKKNQTIEIKYY